MATVLAIPTMVLLSQAHPILKLLRQSDALAAMASDYIHAILPSVLPFLLFTVMVG